MPALQGNQADLEVEVINGGIRSQRVIAQPEVRVHGLLAKVQGKQQRLCVDNLQSNWSYAQPPPRNYISCATNSWSEPEEGNLGRVGPAVHVHIRLG